MNQPRLNSELSEVPSNRAIVLRNETCPYCGCELTNENRTKEHVVGRRFVPKGKLDGSWNLIVFACRGCNNRKADLEDEISATTLQPDLSAKFFHGDHRAADLARSKAAGAISRRTGKPVGDSKEQLIFSVPFAPGISGTFTFTAPAQPDQDRLFNLARYHLMGFFYFITFQESQRRGYFWTGGFHPFMHANRPDWGNVQMMAFANAVVGWEPRVMASTADGFFKCIIRRNPHAENWSFALEWNHSTRVIGFLGDRATAQAIVDAFPPLQMRSIDKDPANRIAFRREVPLAEDELDRLFLYDDGSDGGVPLAPVSGGEDEHAS